MIPVPLCLPIRLFSIVEPGSEGLPGIERAVRLGNLTAGMIDATDAQALKLLDVIVLSHSYALRASAIRSITEAVESGVGLYNEGHAGSIIPGPNDPRICRLMLTTQAAVYHTPGHSLTMSATVLQSHPILRGLPVGEHLQVYGCGTVCVPTLDGAQVLIRKDTPVDPLFPKIPALHNTRMPVLTVGHLGRGRVAVVQDSQTLANHPGIRGGFLKNAFEWLAEPRLHERMQSHLSR